VDAVILYLVRHGRTLHGEGRCVGHSDLEMDPEAGEALASLAASFEVAPPRLFSSDLARARSTLSALAHGWGGTIEVDARLREMNFGDWDGRTWVEIREADGERLQGWMDDWVERRVPGGESFADVALRVASWSDEILHGETSLLAVAHAGSIRALLCHLLEWPLDRAFRLQVDHGRISAVKLGESPTLLFLNADRVPLT
jgi:alpha-ribazole phosphatase